MPTLVARHLGGSKDIGALRRPAASAWADRNLTRQLVEESGEKVDNLPTSRAGTPPCAWSQSI